MLMADARDANNFNLIRLLLAVLVVFSHSHSHIGHAEPVTWGITFGYFAVQSFFCISGYLIAQSFLRARSVLEFAFHRALRIVPALVPLAAFMAASWYVLRYDLLLQNPPLWTLNWEAACYALAALAGLCGLLGKRTIWLLAIAACIAYLTYVDHTSYVFRYIVCLFMLFLAGAVIAVHEDRISFRFAGPIALGIVAFVLLPYSRETMIATAELWMTPALAYAVANLPYMAALPVAWVYLAKHTPVLVALKADLSYGVYIYGWPVQIIVAVVAYWYVQPITNVLVHFIMSMSLLIPIAYLSWTLVEKPALSAKKFFRGRHGGLAEPAPI